ncbi:unnamed protein product [Vicia faba]|uniref:HAT C-terminal dimerisation domain-containing protein n=1 Tax=Vicia faba TaxID=3906 RepID=A0AAV1A8X0_VICFA|nr:unnamed protein product [Vicia faba]
MKLLADANVKSREGSDLVVNSAHSGCYRGAPDRSGALPHAHMGAVVDRGSRALSPLDQVVDSGHLPGGADLISTSHILLCALFPPCALFFHLLLLRRSTSSPFQQQLASLLLLLRSTSPPFQQAAASNPSSTSPFHFSVRLLRSTSPFHSQPASNVKAILCADMVEKERIKKGIQEVSVQLDADDTIDIKEIRRIRTVKRIVESETSSMAVNRTKGPLDLVYKKSKDTSINDACDKEARARTIQYVGRFFYTCGVACNVANARAFKLMLEAVGSYGPHLKPPSYHELRVPILRNELEYTKGLLKNQETIGNVELVKQEVTRFATHFLCLQRMQELKGKLREMFLCEEWMSSKCAKDAKGQRAATTILTTSFWNDVLYTLKCMAPLVNVLRMVDNERKPAMGYIYAAMGVAKESIEKAFSSNSSKYKVVFEIIDERWECQLHHPLHSAVEDLISEQLSQYTGTTGLFGIRAAIRQRSTLAPAEWWKSYGAETPELQLLVVKVLSLSCSASDVSVTGTSLSIFIPRREINWNIKDCKTWCLSRDDGEDLVHPNHDITWSQIADASGANEPIIYTRRTTRATMTPRAPMAQQVVEDVEVEDKELKEDVEEVEDEELEEYVEEVEDEELEEYFDDAT